MSIRSQTTQPDDLKLVYVSTVGSDLNSGNSISKPVRTIKRAVEIANAYITSPSRLAQINVASGVYSEILPIRVKYNVVIKGDTLRSTYIEPATGYEYEGFFKVDSNFKLWGCTLRGHQADATRQAWAISFDELADNQHRGAIGLGAFITTSPYIQNCTSYTAEDDAGLAGSASTGNTGGGMEVDGAKCAINSPIKSMVVDSYTQVNLGGPGILVKNDGYAQLVSCFGTFCTYHTKAESGGQVNMSGGSTSDFGDTGLVADGYSPTPLYTGAARLATYGATRLEKNVTIDTSTDTFTSTSHGLVAGDQVRFAVSQGTLPTNLVASTNYFVIAAGLTANTFRVSATSGGTALDMTGTATGTYTFVRQGAVQIDVVDFTPNRLGRAIAYPSTGSLGSPGNPVTISARGGSTAGSSFTVTLGTVANIKHQWIGGGTVTVGGTSYPITSATYNNATGATVLAATGYAPTIGASITLSGLTFICDSASRPNAGQLIFPQLVFPRDASTGAAQAKTFAYTRTGNFTLTYQEAASSNGPEHEYVSGGTATIGGVDYGVAGATYNKTTGVVTLTTKTQLPAGNGNITVEGLVFICPSSAYIVTASTPIDSSGTPVAKDSPTRAGYRVEFFSGVNGGLKDPVTQGQRLDFRNRSQIAAGAHTFEFVGSGTNYDALPWNGGVANPANAVLESNNGRVYYSATTERGDFSVGSQFKVDGTTGEVTISTSQFNLSGLNFIGPFSRNGGLSTVGEQLREVSNNPALIASTGAADGNTVPTQSAIVGYLTNRTVTGGAGLTGGGNLVANQVISANLKVNGGLVFDNGAIAVDLSASNIAGTLGFIDGGTGATTQQGAINALAGATTAGRFLRGDGTNVTLAAIQASDVPTLNQNTTGTASNVTGVVVPANGGTGLTALGAGIATFLATPTSANLAAAVTDEAGTGALVFTNSPTIASPTFTGTPIGPTAAVDTNTTQLATTAFVVGQGYLKSATATSTYAPLASPSLTGTPLAPTAIAGTSTTQIATTAFVATAIGNLINGAPGALDTLNELAASLGNDANFSATVTNALALKSPLASPTFTGTPTAPTAAVDTNTTQLATTAFVVGQGYLKSATATSTYAPLNSPSFTGTPTAPTAAVDTNTQALATTAFVVGQGYLKSATATSTYAPLNSPTFTGTVSGITKAMVGLGNVANRSLVAGTNVSIVDDGTSLTVSAGGAGGGTVISVSATSPVQSTGGTSPVISLASGYGDTQNPYSAKAATFVLAGPDSGANQTPAFRALLATDIPTLTSAKLSDFATAATAAVQSQIDSKLNSASLGAANGVASLDSGGKVPSSQLPSYVDDVLEFASLAALPATGETGKIYVAIDNGKCYRWTGSTYVEISPSEVNSVAGKTGVVSLVKADVGLGNVDNTSDANKPISTATQAALDLKANTSGTNATGTWGISITGNAATTTNGVVTTGTYADPAWITSLSANKITGPILLLERTAQTADYTLALADAGQVVVMGATGAVTLTVPTEATVAFAIGTVINIYNTSANTLTIAEASGVTVRNNSTGLAQYQEVSIRKRANNEWVRVG